MIMKEKTWEDIEDYISFKIIDTFLTVFITLMTIKILEPLFQGYSEVIKEVAIRSIMR